MFKNTAITRKFPLVMVSFALLSALVTGVVAYNTAKNSLTKSSENKIISLLESRKSSLNNYIDTIKMMLIFMLRALLLLMPFKSFQLHGHS